MTPDLHMMADSPVEFRKALIIERADLGQARLGECAAPFQNDVFDAMDPAWRKLVYPSGPDPMYRRLWSERHRGASKTTDAAVQALYPLLFAPRPVAGVAVACDQEQAGLIRAAIQRLVWLNPWIGDTLQVDKLKVRNTRTESELTILAADVSSSYGLLLDFAICDEVALWPNDSMWASIISTIGKRPHAVLVVLGNAGWRSSWAWPVREAVRQDPGWYFQSMDTVAPWINERELAEQRRLLPPESFDRLWRNIWASGSGDALPEGDVDVAIRLPGPTYGWRDGCSAFCGIDLSVSRDHSAICVLGADHRRSRVELWDVKSWAPPPGGRVDLQAVKRAVLVARERFGFKGLRADPYQAELLLQELETACPDLICERIPFTAKSMAEMATATLGAFSTGVVDLYNDPGLVRDLKELRFVERPAGYRLEAARNDAGHGDRGTAFCLALPRALQLASVPPPDFDVDGLGDNLLTAMRRGGDW